MIEQLASWDHDLFFFVNHGAENDLFNFLMPWIRESKLWIPLYVLFLFAIIRLKGKRSWLWIIGILLAVGASDYLASGVFKPHFARPRPCNHQGLNQEVILRKLDGNCGGRYGFASSHAANHFALAMFLSLTMAFSRRSVWPYLLFFWAGCISFAQVYVGVHFPGDVFVGALLGILSAIFLFRITLFAEQKIYS